MEMKVFMADLKESLYVLLQRFKCKHKWEEIGNYRMMFEPPNVKAWQCTECGKLKAKSF
jgi:hypothetical protein